MPNLTFTGIGSGLQVSEIVSALVGAERAPFESRANTQESKITTDISAIGSLKGALESVSSAISSLADATNFQLRSASGSDSFVGITSTKDAQIGSYSVKVDALASVHKLTSSAFTSTEAVGDGSLAISSGSNSFAVTVSATDTLADVRDSINNSVDNSSTVATIVTDDAGQHLILTSNLTGVANAITVKATDTSDGNNADNVGLSRLAYDLTALDINGNSAPITNLTETIPAADAQITIDGSLVVTNSTNEFNNVIDGVDVTAKKVHSATDDISQISFTADNSNIKAGLDEFVKSYNELQKLSKELGKSSESGGGALAGDSLLRGVMTKIRQELTTNFDIGNGETLSLSQLGVRSDRYGVLSLDSTELNSFIDSNIDGVQQFFVGTSTSDGFASSFETLTNFYTDSDGIIQNRIDSRNEQLSRLDDERVAFGLKMDSLEARLNAQYNAMDLIVSGLNSTSTYLMAQLNNMPGVVRSTKN
jgi:flagellar hook-associated protein 2